MDRKRGRPPIDDDDPSVSVHVKLPSREYDALFAKSQRERVTIPELLRRAVRRDDDGEK